MNESEKKHSIEQNNPTTIKKIHIKNNNKNLCSGNRK